MKRQHSTAQRQNCLPEQWLANTTHDRIRCNVVADVQNPGCFYC